MENRVIRSKKSKPRNARPYDRPNQSILGRVASKVKGIFTPSWIKSWIGGPGDDPGGTSTENDDIPSEKEESTLQYPLRNAKRPKLRLHEDHSAGGAQTWTNMPSSSNSQPNVPLSNQFQPSSSALPSNFVYGQVHSMQPPVGPGSLVENKDSSIMMNGDDHSENSEGSASTSGCSSLVSHKDRSNCISSTSLRLNESALKNLRGDLKGVMGFKGRRDMASQKESGDTSASRMSLWSSGHSPSNRSPIVPRSNQTSFNVSAFVGPSKSSQLQSEEKVTSPFYKGKTTFGGASSSRKLAVGSSPYQVEKRMPYQIKVRSNQSEDNDGMSSAARRILQTLEKMSSPVTDAKKIPNTDRSPVDLSIYLKPPKHRIKLQSTPNIPSRGPPIANISTISKLTTLKNCGVKRFQNSYMDSPPIMERESPLATAVTAQIPKISEASGGGGGGKIVNKRHQQHLSSKQSAVEELPESPSLPNIPLPIFSLPTFNFGSKSETSSADKPVAPEDFLFPNFTSRNERSTINKLSTVEDFLFSNPIIEHVLPNSTVSSATPQVSSVFSPRAESQVQDQIPFTFSSPIEHELPVNSAFSASSTSQSTGNVPEKWECHSCSTRNLAYLSKCVDCETPKPSRTTASPANSFKGIPLQGSIFGSRTGFFSAPPDEPNSGFKLPDPLNGPTNLTVSFGGSSIPIKPSDEADSSKIPANKPSSASVSSAATPTISSSKTLLSSTSELKSSNTSCKSVEEFLSRNKDKSKGLNLEPSEKSVEPASDVSESSTQSISGATAASSIINPSAPLTANDLFSSAISSSVTASTNDPKSIFGSRSKTEDKTSVSSVPATSSFSSSATGIQSSAFTLPKPTTFSVSSTLASFTATPHTQTPSAKWKCSACWSENEPTHNKCLACTEPRVTTMSTVASASQPSLGQSPFMPQSSSGTGFKLGDSLNGPVQLTVPFGGASIPVSTPASLDEKPPTETKNITASKQATDSLTSTIASSAASGQLLFSSSCSELKEIIKTSNTSIKPSEQFLIGNDKDKPKGFNFGNTASENSTNTFSNKFGGVAAGTEKPNESTSKSVFGGTIAPAFSSTESSAKNAFAEAVSAGAATAAAAFGAGDSKNIFGSSNTPSVAQFNFGSGSSFNNEPRKRAVDQDSGSSSDNFKTKPSSAFNAPATTAGFAFGSSTVATTQAGSQQMTFFSASTAATSTAPAAANPGLFSFGAAASNTATTQAPSGFTFKGSEEKSSTAGGFNFANPAASASAAAPPAFKFGAPAAAAAPTPPSGGFSFGNPPASTASSGFTFGSSSTSTANPSAFSGFQSNAGFQFGSQATNISNPAPAFSTSTAPFAFGSLRAENPSSQQGSGTSFPFGTSQQPPGGFNFAPNASASTQVFQFGGNAERRQAATSGFNFAGPASGSESVNTFSGTPFNMSTPSSFNFVASSPAQGPFQFNAPASTDPAPSSTGPRKIRKAVRRHRT